MSYIVRGGGQAAEGSGGKEAKAGFPALTREAEALVSGGDSLRWAGRDLGELRRGTVVSASGERLPPREAHAGCPHLAAWIWGDLSLHRA